MYIEETYVMKIANPYPVMQSQDCGNDCSSNAISLYSLLSSNANIQS